MQPLVHTIASKIVPIPERPKEKTMAAPADFVRNVMGSSAGAGSGEFHVYRRIRRRECTREKLMQEKSEKELKDEEFQRQIEEKKKALEEKTAKKRQKRLKKKQKAKDPKKQKVDTQEKSEENKSDESDENEED
ncbi:hypothetical protein QYM36_012295 [Artemia franciscana]|uniref:PRKR-interacting protein 1 n=1 Tax=Artemia franciscana TaxID=6661 RepID=A0AA88KZS4_ARTSF|nr:hypothetical protein QYM36_012295 [Artemia franciscana]